MDFPLSPRVMMAPHAKSRRHLRVAFGFLGLDLNKIRVLQPAISLAGMSIAIKKRLRHATSLPMCASVSSVHSDMDEAPYTTWLPALFQRPPTAAAPAPLRSSALKSFVSLAMRQTVVHNIKQRCRIQFFLVFSLPARNRYQCPSGSGGCQREVSGGNERQSFGVC